MQIYLRVDFLLYWHHKNKNNNMTINVLYNYDMTVCIPSIILNYSYTYTHLAFPVKYILYYIITHWI